MLTLERNGVVVEGKELRLIGAERANCCMSRKPLNAATSWK